MNGSLTPGEFKRFVKIAAGERAIAALKASELLHRHGLTWADALRQPSREPNSGRVVVEPRRAVDWNKAARLCRLRHDLFDDWELFFLKSIAERRAPPTPKQLSRLEALCARAGVLA